MPDGSILLVRVYERRGATFSDRVLLSRQALLDRLKKGKKFVVGEGVKGKITVVYQVVTDVSIATINTATAQLLLNNTDLPERPLLTLIVPKAIDQSLETKLKKLGISILEYEWQENHAVFPRLPALICKS